MKYPKFRSLKIQLFSNFTLLFIVMWIVFDAFIYSYFSNQIEKRVYENQLQTCYAIENSLNSKIDFINTLSLNIYNSPLVRNSFIEQTKLQSSYNHGALENKGQMYAHATDCSNILSNIVGFQYYNAPQVNLYDLSGNVIGYGYYNGLSQANFSQCNWYKTVKDLNGARYISTPHSMEWLQNPSASSDDKYISLTRVYKDIHYTPIGYIEVMQTCHNFFDYPEQLESTSPHSKIFILNEHGELLYPYNTDHKQSLSAILPKLDEFNNNENHSFTSIEINGMKYLLFSTVSGDHDFRIISLQPYTVISNAMNDFNRFFFLFAVLFLLIILILSFVISNKIARPLTNLRSSIKEIDLSELATTKPNEIETYSTDFEEISKVIHAYNKMHEKLKITVNELLLSKNEEINSRILAIQAQMNPHFLHNNLATISSMADENMNDQIKHLCQNLSFMLRYIAAEKKNGVELMQEVDYSRNYVDCMKLRYENDLDIQIDVPDSMWNIQVPKLIIQPLIENAIRHAFHATPPPWKISVSGQYTPDYFKIIVTDHGDGFSKESLKKIHLQMAEFDKTAQIPNLEINGMGLINIYVRFKLTYKDDAIFEIESNVGEGCQITIGAYINH